MKINNLIKPTILYNNFKSSCLTFLEVFYREFLDLQLNLCISVTNDPNKL